MILRGWIDLIVNQTNKFINEVGHKNVVQIITDNASNCKAAGEIIESTFPHIYWTACVFYTLNLALKNICAARNVEKNEATYEEYNWINDVRRDALAIKHLIMNHNMRLTIFCKFLLSNCLQLPIHVLLISL